MARRWADTTPAAPLLLVTLVAALAGVLRWPLRDVPAGIDEAGYLVVGARWDGPGRSTYGDYFVDRPPGLVTLFRVAAEHGGLPTVRLLGIVCVVLVVLLCALAAWRTTRTQGPGAAGTAAVVAAAAAAVWTNAPRMGAGPVNAELLAAVPVALVLVLLPRAVERVRAGHRWSAALGLVVAGASAVLAVSVKQNMLDGGVFAVSGLLACWWTGRLTTRAWLRAALVLAAGAVATAPVVLEWSARHGTGPGELLAAVYGFRVDAITVTTALRGEQNLQRAGEMTTAALVSGAPLVAAVLVWGVAASVLRHRRRADPWGIALLVTTSYAAVSVGLGSSFWLHYLVEMVVPLSVGAGWVAGRSVGARRTVTAVLAVAAVVAAPSWVSVAAMDAPAPQTTLGEAVAAVARPGDSIVTSVGMPVVVESSGLPSPYPYLWALPAYVLDTDERALRSLVGRPDGPTWLVVAEDPVDTALAEVARQEYRPVAGGCGGQVWLRRDQRRPTPTVPAC